MDTVFVESQSLTAFKQFFIPVGSLIVAFVGVVFSPVVNFVVAKRQAQVAINVARRQAALPMKKEWVQRLQTMVVDICLEAHMLVYGIQTGMLTDPSEGAVRYQKLYHSVQSIRVMLNTQRKSHENVLEKVHALLMTFPSAFPWDKAVVDRLSDATEDFLTVSTEMLNREWDEISKFEEEEVP